MEDETNADPEAAARNLLRLRVMPLLREVNSRAAEHMAQTASRLREMEEDLSDLTERYLRAVSVQSGRVTIRLGDLAEVPGFLRAQVLLGMFDLLGVGRKDIGAVHLEALYRLWNGHGNDARVSLPHGVTARLAASRLVLETLPSPLSRAELVRDCPLHWGDYAVTLLDHRMGEGLALRPGPEWEAVAVAPCDAGGAADSAGDSRRQPQCQASVPGPAHFPLGAGPAAGHLCGRSSGRRVAAGCGYRLRTGGGGPLPVYSNFEDNRGERP